MRWTAILYGAVGSAALVAGVLIPWLVHSQGSARVPGWQGLVNPGAMSQAHAFLGNQCQACHVPHQGVEARQCLTCHAATSFTAKASTRFHAEATACASCHTEHLGRRAPTRMDHAVLLDRRVWSPARIPPGGIRIAALDCASCHGVKDPHQGLMGATCSQCHGTQTWRITGFQHPPESSTQCAECHRPPPSHAMMHFGMVSQRVAGRKARVDQCFACHATDDWNNIRDVGRYDHH
jgi:hypothetical protein